MPKKKQAPLVDLSEVTIGIAECMANDLDLIRSQTHPEGAATLLPKTGPAVGDIIQVTDHSHPKHKAWIGIVHYIEGQEITCYQPDGRAPNVFKVNTGSVEVVGKARLKWPGPLPEKSKDYNKLDKV